MHFPIYSIQREAIKEIENNFSSFFFSFDRVSLKWQQKKTFGPYNQMWFVLDKLSVFTI